jgi:hypothetical protein
MLDEQKAEHSVPHYENYLELMTGEQLEGSLVVRMVETRVGKTVGK